MSYGFLRLCTQTGRSRGALYMRCTIPATCMAVHHPMENTLVPTAYSYTRCTDLYSSKTEDAVRLPQAVYTNWEVPWRLVHEVYNSGNAHGSSPPDGKHPGVNGIFVHPLYGSVQLQGHGCHMAATVCVHKLGGPLESRALGVRFLATRMAAPHPMENTLA